MSTSAQRNAVIVEASKDYETALDSALFKLNSLIPPSEERTNLLVAITWLVLRARELQELQDKNEMINKINNMANNLDT